MSDLTIQLSKEMINRLQDAAGRQHVPISDTVQAALDCPFTCEMRHLAQG